MLQRGSKAYPFTPFLFFSLKNRVCCFKKDTNVHLCILFYSQDLRPFCGTHLFDFYRSTPPLNTCTHPVANMISKEQLPIKVFSLFSYHQHELCWHCFCSNLALGKSVPTGILWHGKSSINHHINPNNRISN